MSRLKDRWSSLRRPEPAEGSRPRRDDPDSELVSTGSTSRQSAIVFQAAALVLAYPDEALLDRLDVIEAALADTWADTHFAPVLAHLRGESLVEHDAIRLVELVETSAGGLDELDQRLRALQAYHVQEFDLSRKHALHLSYWTDGDTRRRGEVLADIKRVYRESGLLVDTGGELPDYLPMVLEFAVADPERGRELLQRFRASLELIRLGLEADKLPHAGVLTAICACLPGESPKTRAEIQARYGEIQPLELVGIGTPVLGRPPLVEPVETTGVRS